MHHMKRATRLLLALLIALAFTAGACGDDDDSEVGTEGDEQIVDDEATEDDMSEEDMSEGDMGDESDDMSEESHDMSDEDMSDDS